jgi:hypothetical protein
MDAHGLLEKNKEFAWASGRFQLACYKEEIEANLRTPGLGGFQLLDLHDYLGQGTALVGLLDAFWESKGYASAEEFTEFCNATVPLARLPSRVYTTADKFTADVELAHFGAEPMKDAKAVWRIDGGRAQGEWEVRTFPIGKNIPLGRVSVDLSPDDAPAQHKLIVTVAPISMFDPSTGRIRSGAVKGTDYFENEWNFGFIQPQCPPSFTDRPCARSHDRRTSSSHVRGPKLNRSCRRWQGSVRPECFRARLDESAARHVPVFWNRQMGPGWGRMLGLLIGGAGLGFPSESHFDWQWSSLMTNVRAINLDRFPKDLEPNVWAIDDWNRNYKLGVIFECTVGDGKLMVSAIDVSKPDDKNIVARQLRYSLLNYMASDCFNPRVPVLPGTIRSMFFNTRIMKELGATAQIDGQPAGMAIDGDPNTYALAGDPRADIREPIELTITFPAPVVMSGLIIMARQNHREHEGDIREFSVRVSDDGSDWRPVRSGELLSTFAPQKIEFSERITTRYLKLTSLSGFGNDKRTALAEVAIMYGGPRLSDSGSGAIEYERNRSATPEIDEGTGARPKPSPTPSIRKP